MLVKSTLFLPLRQMVGRLLVRVIETPVDTRKRQMNWDFQTDPEIYNALVGLSFGPNPEHKKDTIRKAKKEEACHLERVLELNSNDTVLDLGSGTGDLAGALSSKVKKVLCADISAGFLARCREETKEFRNIEYHLIQNGNLGAISDGSVDKGYSIAVFIHLNLFDITFYFRELYRVLNSGGKFLFTIMDSDSLDIHRDPYFLEMAELYRSDRHSLFNLMNWNSGGTVRAIAKQIGFTEATVIDRNGANVTILLKRP